MRTEEQLSKHKAKCAHCRESYFILDYKPEFLASHPEQKYKSKLIPLPCNSYFCASCAAKKQREIVERFEKFKGKESWRFLTLTLQNNGSNTSENLKSFSGFFNNFMTTIRKRYKGIKYLSVIEIGKSGNVHCHILINKYIWQPIASGLWKKASGSFIVHVEKVYNSVGCKKYISKYVSKFQKFEDTNSLFYLLNVKRVAWSQNFEKFFREKIFIGCSPDALLNLDRLLNLFVLDKIFHSSMTETTDFSCLPPPLLQAAISQAVPASLIFDKF
jgi:hypothetical protein